LSINEIDTILLPDYNIGAKFCRNIFKKGGVCMHINESIYSTNKDLKKFCKEKDLKVCAVMMYFSSYEVCIITIYRSPSGNFQYFIDNLEKILNMIYSNTKEIIICGDINVNYLIDSTHKQLLDTLLASYGLSSTVQFPTRIQNKSSSAIDNLFISTFKFSNFSLHPVINGLHDHDAQILIIHNLFDQNSNNYFYFKRKIGQIFD
jgi:exonuclease III